MSYLLKISNLIWNRAIEIVVEQIKVMQLSQFTDFRELLLSSLKKLFLKSRKVSLERFVMVRGIVPTRLLTLLPVADVLLVGEGPRTKRSRR